MAERTTPMFTLVYYEFGKEVSSICTNNFNEARRAYWDQFGRSGTAPRLYVDGVRQTISAADKMMGISKLSRPIQGARKGGER